MKLKKDTWHYNLWAQTCDQPWRIQQTNLCSYCQRVFWCIMYWIVIGGGLIFVLGTLLWGIFVCFWKHTAVTCGTFAAFATVIGLGYLIARWRQERRFEPKPPPSLFSQWLSAKKQKVCPLVEFEE